MRTLLYILFTCTYRTSTEIFCILIKDIYLSLGSSVFNCLVRGFHGFQVLPFDWLKEDDPLMKRSLMNASLASLPAASARSTSNSTSGETGAPDARL